MVMDKIPYNLYLKNSYYDDTSWLKHAFALRTNNSDGFTRTERVKRFAHSLLGSDYDVFMGNQVHQDSIAIIDNNTETDKEDVTVFPDTDALILTKPKTAIAVITADCAPVMITDHRKKITALIHSGWKGTLSGIVPKCIMKMYEIFDSSSQDISAWIAPTILGCCYEVGDEVLEQFRNTFDFHKNIINGRYLNISETIRIQLNGCGITPEKIMCANVCTKCNQEILYSHRAGNDGKGSNILIAAIL